MKNNYARLAVLLISAILSGCHSPSGSKSESKTDSLSKAVSDSSGSGQAARSRASADSIDLTALVRNLYKWHAIRSRNYKSNSFAPPFKFNSASDSIFTGVDWKEYNNDISEYKKTDFFTDDFFAQLHAIATRLDSSIKQAGIEYRNANDGISLWDSDVDDWCNCQDAPDNYWKFMTLADFKLSENSATFSWKWDKKDPFKYEMKAKKEDGRWKISYMMGMKNYGTVADYKKMMGNHGK